MNSITHINLRSVFLLAASFACVGFASAQADESPCPNCGCAHGIQLIEVSRTVCKMVTKQEPIKKTVYEKKEVPFCEHCVAPIGHHHVCPQCKACAKTRTVLVKKSIECGKKTVHECVPEVIKEQVAVPCRECGFCTRHGHALHSANTSMPAPEVKVSAVDQQVSEAGMVELATEPKLREKMPMVR